MFCKINNKRINISFLNAFYVFECFLNLINFDQLNDLCLMTYKFKIFIVENQNIIIKKRVNNMFFFQLWKYMKYNFIVTFIVDNFAMSSNESKIKINKNILNVWYARLKYLRAQNVRRLVKMSKKMNLIKFIANKNFCESCIVIKQKIESHNNFVIFDKHFLNLMWSDLIQSFVFNDKIKYFVTFLYDFIKRSMIYVLYVKFDTFDVFKHLVGTSTMMIRIKSVYWWCSLLLNEYKVMILSTVWSICRGVGHVTHTNPYSVRLLTNLPSEVGKTFWIYTFSAT